MSRSLRVQHKYIHKVKLCLRNKGYPSQRALAEDVGYALATVNNFLTGKPVDFTTFEELCRRLALDWKEIAATDVKASFKTSHNNLNTGNTKENQSQKPPYPHGALPLDSPFYLERHPIEAQIKEEIQKPGALVTIKAPRETGKTSLLLRILETAKSLGYRTVNLNLEQVDQLIFRNIYQFLRLLAAYTTRKLQLKPRLNEYWDHDLGNKISCTYYFEDYLLECIDTPLVLAIDEVNQIFQHPEVAKDFLTLLRSWHEQAKNLDIWQKLRLILVHSTEIYVPFQFNQSLLNVGLPIQLNSFSLEDVSQLAQRYQLKWQDKENARQLMDMVGGHPVLVQTALYHLSLGDITLEKLLETATTSTGIYAAHLQRYGVSLQEDPILAEAFKQVIGTTEPVVLDPIPAYKLSSMGLITKLGNKAMPGNKLYQKYFLES